MVFKTLRLEVLTQSPNSNIVARIRRNDNKLYNVDTAKFQAEGSFNSLIPMKPGQGLDKGIASVLLDLNPSEFIDGDYYVYYYDASYSVPKLFEGAQVSVFNGTAQSQKIPSTTDIAMRILDSRIGDTTVRNVLAKINDSLKTNKP